MKALELAGNGIYQIEVDNTLEALQTIVGGNIETVPLVPDRAVMIVNEEGLLLGLEPNLMATFAAGTDIVGRAIIVGIDCEEFTDVPEDVIRTVCALFT